MSEKTKNRILIAFAGVVIQFCMGAVYAWSVFRNPIQKLMGWNTAEVSMAYSIHLVFIPILFIASGYLMPRITPKLTCMLGGTMIFLGFFMASKATSLAMLYFGYGFLGGGGIGMSYAVPIAILVRWFPERKGAITGIAVGSLGFGSVVFTQVAYNLIVANGPFETFFQLGLIIFIGVIAGSFLMVPPQQGYAPPGWTPPAKVAGKATGAYDFTPKEVLGTSQYWFILIMYTCANLAGLMIIGHAAPIGVEVVKLTPATSAAIAAQLGIWNSCGRLFWGWFSDKIGRFNAVLGMFAVMTFSLVLMYSVTSFWTFAFSASAIAFCFGGGMGTYPALAADVFGPKYLSVNYGLIFLGFSIGGVLGPQLAAYVKQATGGQYYLAFIIAAGLCIVGGIISKTLTAPKPPESVTM